MLLLGDEAAARELGREPLARIVSRGAHGVDPDVFGIAPVEAANKALARAGIGWDDVAVVELNEAFASQSLACLARLARARPRQAQPARRRDRASDIRWALRARGSSAASPTSCSAAAAATASPRSASASAKAWPSSWRHERDESAREREAGIVRPGHRDADRVPPRGRRRSPADGLSRPTSRPQLRHPKQPLVYLPQSVTEITGPQLGPARWSAGATTTSRVQHEGEPIGERITVSGRVFDTEGKPLREHAGGDLAGERRRPLPAPRGIAGRRRWTRTSPAPGAA